MTNPARDGFDTAAQLGGSDVRETVDRVQEIVSIRDRHEKRLTRADRLSALLLGWGFIALAGAIAVLGGGWPAFDGSRTWAWIGLVALYALAHDTLFASATGSAVPTQPILVAMLLTLPLHLVPVTLLAGVLLGAALSPGSGRWDYRVGLDAMSAWHCIGPVAVLAVAGFDGPSLSHWPVYLAAVAAQFAVDAVVAIIRCLALGASLRALVAPMTWTFGVDTLLAPIGLTAVITAGSSPAALILLAAPLGLIRMLAADRSAQLEQAVTLGTAFAEVSTQARVDSMTGVANRRGWEEALTAAEDARIRDYRQGFAVVMADLDHLKRTNDTFGHQAGDELIRQAARILTETAPPGALVARLGGDEFGVLIPNPANPLVGETMMAAVREVLAGMPREPQVSMSLGAAACPPAVTVHGAVEIADAASARDKANRRVGRDEQAGALTHY